MKNRVFETVLYYTPEPSETAVKLKGVLVRMGIRIKNISQEQAGETIGSLLGITGYEKSNEGDRAAEKEEKEEKVLPVMDQEMLVMHRFSERRLDELLMNLRKAGVPKIALKAIVTESNAGWSFGHLYEELLEEHQRMSGMGQ